MEAMQMAEKLLKKGAWLPWWSRILPGNQHGTVSDAYGTYMLSLRADRGREVDLTFVVELP